MCTNSSFRHQNKCSFPSPRAHITINNSTNFEFDCGALSPASSLNQATNHSTTPALFCVGVVSYEIYNPQHTLLLQQIYSVLCRQNACVSLFLCTEVVIPPSTYSAQAAGRLAKALLFLTYALFLSLTPPPVLHPSHSIASNPLPPPNLLSTTPSPSLFVRRQHRTLNSPLSAARLSLPPCCLPSATHMRLSPAFLPSVPPVTDYCMYTSPASPLFLRRSAVWRNLVTRPRFMRSQQQTNT